MTAELCRKALKGAGPTRALTTLPGVKPAEGAHAVLTVPDSTREPAYMTILLCL